MHCANLDTLVKVTTANPLHQSPAHSASPPQLTQNMETREEESMRMLKMVLDAGILILEGRLPDRTSKRGCVEGPHCVLYPNKQQTHLCDFNNYLCQRVQKYRQLIQSIWTECGGLCIELRVCADCACGQDQVWKSTTSRHDHVLEQWYFEVTDYRNNGEDIGVMNAYGLMQAIRSQIHFSQLSAWWCSNRAQLPKNISYRVLPLKQSDANSCPLQHKFPVLAFSTSYLQVNLRSQPRSEVLPKVLCPLHCNQDKVVDDRMKICCNRLGKHHCQALDDFDENDNERWFSDRNKHSGRAYKPESMMTPISLPKTNSDDNVLSIDDDENDEENVIVEDALEPQRGVPRNTLNSKYLMLRSRPKNGDQVGLNKMSPSHHVPSGTSTMTPVWPPAVADEANAQFVNVCNWTNSMMSNVMSRMRTTNTFFNLTDSNSLYEYLNNKLDLLDNRHRCSGSNSNSDETNRLKPSSADSNRTRVRRGSDCDRRPSEHNSEVASKIPRDLGSGDMKFKIERSFAQNTYELSISDNNCSGPEMNCDEKKPQRGPPSCGPNTSSIVIDKSFLKSKHFHEKRLRFEKSKKRLLPFVGNIIESVLSGRVHFSKAIQNFKIKVGVGGSSTTQNNLTDLPAATYYYHFGDGNLSRSYLVKGFILENEKGLQIPASGRLQVSVFNTEDVLVKLFVISYDLSDMPRCSKTYLRHSNYYSPDGLPEYSLKWLQSFLRMKCSCSKSGRLYLQSEIDVIIFQKSDLNTACEFEAKSDMKHHDVTEIEYKNGADIIL